MKKILLIDDRIDEQNILLNKYGIDLIVYIDILDNLTGEKSKEFFQVFNPNDENYLQYSVWIIHQTLFNNLQGMQRKIEKFCKNNEIKLALFSGSISKPYIKPSSGFLKLHREDLYENLKIFLEYSMKANPPLELLAYGSDWRVRLLINVQDSIEEFLDSDKNMVIDMQRFKSDINNLESAIKILNNKEIFRLTGKVNRETIVSLLNDIGDVISEQMEM